MSGQHIVIVTGGRSYREWLRPVVYGQLDDRHTQFGDFILFHGACQPKDSEEMTGVDRYADDWGSLRPDITVEQRPADWDRYFKSAGPIRNKAMVEETLQLAPPERIHGLAFPDMHSPGTWNCIQNMKAHGIEVDIWTIRRARQWMAEKESH